MFLCREVTFFPSGIFVRLKVCSTQRLWSTNSAPRDAMSMLLPGGLSKAGEAFELDSFFPSQPGGSFNMFRRFPVGSFGAGHKMCLARCHHLPTTSHETGVCLGYGSLCHPRHLWPLPCGGCPPAPGVAGAKWIFCTQEETQFLNAVFSFIGGSFGTPRQPPEPLYCFTTRFGLLTNLKADYCHSLCRRETLSTRKSSKFGVRNQPKPRHLQIAMLGSRNVIQPIFIWERW